MEFVGPKVAICAFVGGFLEAGADQRDLLPSQRKKLQTDSTVVTTEALACAKTRLISGFGTELDQVSLTEPFCSLKFQADQVASKRLLLFGRLGFANQTLTHSRRGTVLDASLRRRLDFRVPRDRDRLQGRNRERRGTRSFSGHWWERWYERLCVRVQQGFVDLAH